MKPGGLLPFLHKPAIGPYLEQDLSSLQHYYSRPQIHFNIILPSASPLTLKVSLPQVFPLKILYAFLDSSMRATSPAHLSRLDLKFLIMLSKEHSECSSELCKFL